MQATAQKIIDFYASLELSNLKEPGVGVLNPFVKPEVNEIIEVFYNRFYNDPGKRYFLIGINPGRFGAGVTGLPFTDPIVLQEALGIANSLTKRRELSGVYIYELIELLGGIETFYQQFYFTSVSPLGFVKEGKNLNYYDIPTLQKELTPFMVEHMTHQVEKWGRTEVAFTLGKGQNHKELLKLNAKHQWFDKIIALPHPRWVMQYRLKSKNIILDEVVDLIKQGVSDLT